jgi:hypothetical protein
VKFTKTKNPIRDNRYGYKIDVGRSGSAIAIAIAIAIENHNTLSKENNIPTLTKNIPPTKD